MKLSPAKKHLLDKRNEMMLELNAHGYDKADIATIFNMERTWVTRIVNKLLRDTKKQPK